MLAAALYVVATVIFTWPITRGLARDIPGDYGDPLLNIWILAWDAAHFGRGWWDANIFAPHPLALGYSEHLAAQAVQAAPIYWLTGNAILCYNLLFLSTYVLSGVGAFLLARELTGDDAAATVAGLAFAFAPYRATSVPHIQVLSAAWMPFTLYAFRRYFSTGRTRALAGAAAAWLLQNLSCGYYLLFFSPVVLVYLMWEITTRQMWNDRRALTALAATCLAVALFTAPFVAPYLELRRLGFNPRSIGETRRFAADVYGYLTADPSLYIWGRLARAWPKAEGALFPGLTIALLSLYGAARPRTGRESRPVVEQFVLLLLVLVIVWLLLGYSIRLPVLRITRLSRTLAAAGLIAAALLAWSRELRRSAADWIRSPAGWFALAALFAIAMSFGPDIRARDRVVLDTNIYSYFYQYVPGYDGLRVPARFAMIVTLCLAMLAAIGLAKIRRRSAAVVAGVLIAIESFAAPIPINQHSSGYERPGLAPLADLERRAPDVYWYIASLPADAVVAELPLGEPAFDVRYMFYSTVHWRRLVNGYTGGLPDEYDALDRTLQDLFIRPDRAWSALRAAGPTHVIVHESFYLDGRGPLVSDWLRAHGARRTAVFGADRVFQMP